MTSAKIQDGTITDADVSPSGISASKILGGDLQASRLNVGQGHTLRGTLTTIAGGQANYIRDLSDYSAIGGGSDNYIGEGSGLPSTIGGGSRRRLHHLAFPVQLRLAGVAATASSFSRAMPPSTREAKPTASAASFPITPPLAGAKTTTSRPTRNMRLSRGARQLHRHKLAITARLAGAGTSTSGQFGGCHHRGRYQQRHRHDSDYSAIGGGCDNNIADNSPYATIAGGIVNDIGTNSNDSAIGGEI